MAVVASMPQLHVEDSGGSGPPVLFSHGLLWDTRLFAPQVAALRDRYRCIAWDHRGQGRSPVTADGYDMDTLAADAAALIERLGIAPVHYVGLSMGGFVGLRLAIRRPELLRSLTLIDTSAEPEPAANLPRYRLLNLIARVFGIGIVVDRVMPILFGPSFLADPARATERAEYRRRLAGNHRIGITRAVAGVIGRAGVAEQLHRIGTPTLVLVGAEDSATPPDKAAALQRGIAGARMLVVPAAGHTSTLENPVFVTAAIAEFLAGFDAAEEVRR
jgi:pimeloyl-ACP methyl ester carboxylesterase